MITFILLLIIIIILFYVFFLLQYNETYIKNQQTQKVRFIICRFNEDLKFIEYIPPGSEIFIYNRGNHISSDKENVTIFTTSNIGFEPYVYLHYMEDHYNNLADINVFIQASFLRNKTKLSKFKNIFPNMKKPFCYIGSHNISCKDLYQYSIGHYCISIDTSFHKNCPLIQKYNNLGEFFKKNFPEHHLTCNVGYNSFLIINKHVIHSIPQNFITKMKSFVMDEEQTDIIHYYERLWPTFFGKKYLCVLAMFKNETHILEEWIQHYLWQGVDKFYLFDHNSTDNPLTILQKYIDNGLVVYNKITNTEYHNKMQSQLYNQYSRFLKENHRTVWLIITDIDEFWYGHTKPLRQILYYHEDYKVLYCNWKMFGPNNHIHKPDQFRLNLIYRLHDHDPSTESEYTKYILNLDNWNPTETLFIHSAIKDRGRGPNNTNLLLHEKIINDDCSLNHYQYSSQDYYNIKLQRSRPDVIDIIKQNYVYLVDNAIYKDMRLFDLVTNGY